MLNWLDASSTFLFYTAMCMYLVWKKFFVRIPTLYSFTILTIICCSFFFFLFREAEQKKSTKLNQNENLYIFANEFSVILFAILPRRRCCVDIVYIWRYTIQVYRIFSLILLNCYLINTFICLSDTDKQIIYKQKTKIDKWNILCEAYIVHTMLSLAKIKSIRLNFFYQNPRIFIN